MGGGGVRVYGKRAWNKEFSDGWRLGGGEGVGGEWV